MDDTQAWTVIEQAEKKLALKSLAYERWTMGIAEGDDAWKPITPADFLAWWTDEQAIQEDQATSYEQKGEESPFAEWKQEHEEYAHAISVYVQQLLDLGVTPALLPWEEEYILVDDDIDRHGMGCDYGLCNRFGKSYGVSIHMVHRHWSSMDDDARDTYIHSMDGHQERIYAASAESAYMCAKALCFERGWKIVR